MLSIKLCFVRKMSNLHLFDVNVLMYYVLFTANVSKSEAMPQWGHSHSHNALDFKEEDAKESALGTSSQKAVSFSLPLRWIVHWWRGVFFLLLLEGSLSACKPIDELV